VEQGAQLVAASDSKGTVVDQSGLDVEALAGLKEQGRSVIDYPGGEKHGVDGIIDVDCDIWIPAARPDVIREDNAHRLKAKLMLQGANIPCTVGAEKMLHERGVLVIPDFIANAGGVICAAMEYRSATKTQAFEAIAERIRANTEEILREVGERNVMPREAATAIATGRVKEAMSYRRFSLM
jgi:glutamate dehydrogenase (NAD(P)+)